jgi:anti-anti-sigma regulatory factor
MLKITTSETPEEVVITLEGRIAGPWVAELIRIWVETAPRIASRKLSLDLRNVTYADVSGKQALIDIYGQTGAELVASTSWTQYLVEAIKNSSAEHAVEAEDGNDA